MKSKHIMLSYSKIFFKSASFLIILLVTFSQYSILHFDNSNSNQSFVNNEDDLTNINKNAPQSAQDFIDFENAPLLFRIHEKGYIDDRVAANLWYEGFLHSVDYMCYLSINNGEVWALEQFNVVKSLTNLTEFVDGDFTRQLVAESIVQHPEEDVYVKNQIKLYPDEEFFVMTYMIWSETINITSAELFFYNDLDIDETFNDDNADYDPSTELIYSSDKFTHTSLGWISTYPISSWDLGPYTIIEDNVINDALGETISDYGDISLATKYEKKNFNENETWVVPLIYGFATSEADLYTKTVDIKNQFIDDFSVLDFTANLTDNPSVNATILNGGQNELTRNVSVFRNGTYLQSQEITLLPGELDTNVTFDNLLLNPGEYNEITVLINDIINDYQPNNEISHTYLYQERFRINIKDLDGFDVEGLNVSLYHNVSKALIHSAFTDEFGNATFVDLPENNYTLKAYAPWMNENHQLIYEENFTYPDVGDFYQIQSNLTTLILHIMDVEDNSVESASIDIYENFEPETIIWSGLTDQNGNITFLFLNQTYDINVTYFNYEKSLLLEPILDLSLIEKTNRTHQVSLTNLTFHLKNRNIASPTNLTGAKLEFYEKVNSTSFGNYIGFDLVDLIENVSIYWDARINYSIRVIFFGGYCPIGDPEAESLNFTESPYNSYYYLVFNVSIEDYDYLTEIISFNLPPIIYTWEDNIDFKFMINVSGPDYEGPKYADETFIRIQNQNFETVYDGNATNIDGQLGNHSFVLNTSSGIFTSDNPETYFLRIFAQIESYDNPASILLPFSIYNITTDMDLHSSSETLYWKDNFTISANYFNALDNEKIIKDGYATVSWGQNFINYPMQNLGNGTYTIEINSSIGSPGNSIVNVKCYRENYNVQERKFYLNVMEVPTTVNGSILFGSGHSQFVSTQNLTLDYNFIDSYRNISIPDLSPMYSIINSETDEQYTGYLTTNESGFYSFDPKSSLLPIGTYHGLIDFSLENYQSSYASVQLDILPIPLSLTLEGGTSEVENDLEISPDYNIERGEQFYFSLDILDIYDNPVENCTITYILKFTEDNETKKGDLLTDNMGHYFGNFPELSRIGLYSLSLTVSKANYTEETYQFYIDVEYETPIGDIPLPYLIVGAMMLLIAISAVAGYAGIKRIRIPKYIKDLTKLEKILKNTNNVLPERYPTRIEQLEEKYGNRWVQIDFKFPLQPHIDDIKIFINTYQAITGKLFLKEEAKQFLDDLVIYSEEEIKRRLEGERIFGENLSKLMEIILNYIQITNTQHDLKTDSSIVKDDFDLEFGDEK
ncbi:carboxypeptidase-like regulatory domain-containing protein [Promethearchaeum syntrophicum]|uniref:Carboxypeptidase-like regulatory domain-containing protein n=1 Tax=Promethearchaeum syntrophicum TaxID=2594042 RepID=A0A5B9DD55_9ARCH|nr:carboxypeptidase-like regulatory domain-containing protein [Candidatus Prometheoarchaeum syntrophicum]